MAKIRVDLKRQIVVAALKCCDGDLSETFTFEELLVKAWEIDHSAWGLRGFEQNHPDSERIHRELDSRGKKNKGAIDQGLLEKVRPRVYRLTVKGMAIASKTKSSDVELREMVDRKLEDQITKILQHPTFREWLKNPENPNRFRDACHFWEIAPGTPPGVIKTRIQQVEDTITTALDLLNTKGVDEVGERNRKFLFDRETLERCFEFQKEIKERFFDELKMLGA